MPKSSSPTVRLAIIGTGGMANAHAEHFRKIRGCRVTAAVDIDPEKVKNFCANHRIRESYTSVEELLKNSDVSAVSIVTPDAFHAPLSIQCLKAGKHVLCEKPLALHHTDARKMVAAARKAGKINMVNFSYRNWPAFEGISRLIHSGRLGDVRHVEGSYLQSWLVSDAWGDWKTPAWLWRLSSRHGSKGALGDIGVHLVDFVSHPVGPLSEVYCKLGTFRKAKGNRIGEYRLDANDSAVMTVQFKNGALGSLHVTRWCGGHINRIFLNIACSKGTVRFDSEVSTDSYFVSTGKSLSSGTWEERSVKPHPEIHARFINAIRSGKPAQPDFARGAEVQKVLDACFTSDESGAPVRVF